MSIGLSDIRSKIEDSLHREAPEKVWQYLLEHRYVAFFQKGAIDLEKLVEETRKLLDLSADSPRENSRWELGPASGKPSTLRQEAISQLLANAAESEYKEHLARFRNKVLGGKLLALEEVESWIKAQAEKDGLPNQWLDVPLPRETKIEPRKDVPLHFDIRPPLKISELTSDYPVSFSVKTLTYGVHGDSWARHIPIAHDGVLWSLRLLSESLASRYGWKSGQATVFVLTGEPPYVTPLMMTSHWRSVEVASRIELLIDPAMSPNDVAREYRRFRREVVGRRYRSLTEKHIRLVLFADSRPEDETWGERMRAWNKKYPKWKYPRGAEKNFLRDCNQGLKRLLGPGASYGKKTRSE